ncbi:putative pentatricopeptide repeat-containing protein At3g15200 isoform X2 [Apium graveolens]|uniref:putative pentatricopeptide repeat-containing protein At3g15200 isoform X2 n=1 Tax=Apium graveolens TaxID=4045 RepID=UPI003D7B602D
MKFRSLSLVILRSTQFTKHSPHILIPPKSQFQIRRRITQCDSTSSTGHLDNQAIKIQTILQTKANQNVYEIERALNQCHISLTEDLVLNVLKRHRSDWKAAYAFFIWVSRGEDGRDYVPGSGAYNQILDVLGKLKRFDEVHQVLDEMSKRKKGVFNEITYRVVVNRYAAAHRVEEATEFFYRRVQFGLRLDLVAFQTLLLALCRYKHVEAAEFLFHSKQKEFKMDIKTRNIVLNGWCVLGSLREAKRFWNDIVTSKCKPDKFTYGIFINSLSKAGKLSTAVKLFRAMWEKGCDPDVAICNCIIDGLCFKKRIPEAIEIFKEMNDRDCFPDVATYNSLIKHICKIGRMEKVYELLDDMEQKGGSCTPNDRTYGYLLSSTKKPEDVQPILERMERNGCKMTSDVFNLLLRLFMEWGNEERVKSTWVEMERSGLGPDQRSYTIMVHGLFENGKLKDALQYFNQMTLKSLVPEPRTKLLVNAIHIKLQNKKNESGDIGDIGDVMDKVSSLIASRRDRKKNRKDRFNREHNKEVAIKVIDLGDAQYSKFLQGLTSLDVTNLESMYP